MKKKTRRPAAKAEEAAVVGTVTTTVTKIPVVSPTLLAEPPGFLPSEGFR